MTTTISSVVLEVTDAAAAEAFYAALGLGDRGRRSRASEAPTSGFRGFTLSLVCVPAGQRRRLIGARARRLAPRS